VVFSVYTLGCKLNQLETEAIIDSFSRQGFSYASWEDKSMEPSILVINTCTVTSMAEQKARRVIRKALREHPEVCLIVTGCYAQLETGALAAMGADSSGKRSGRFFVIPGDSKDRLLDLPGFLVKNLTKYLQNSSVPSVILCASVRDYFDITTENEDDQSFRFRPENFASHSRAFLKIQDGCDRSCAYCRVSIARGKNRSLGVKEALEELLSLERRGFAELVLTGVNISQYRDSDMALPGLLDFLLSNTGSIRLRLSSLEPEGFSEPDGFGAVLSNKRIRPHFHLSLQSASPKILEKMGRPYTPEDIERIVTLLREIREDPFIACDIIAGFPGESPGEFEKTYQFCEKAGFAWIHVFPFSPRPGTAAYNFPEKPSEKDTAQRVELLMELARKGRREYISRWEGKEVEAVVEAGDAVAKACVPGVSENYLKLCINCGDQPLPAPGSLVFCRIIGEQGRFDAAAELLGMGP